MIRRYLDWRTARARPPVVLSVRAARIGAAATVVGLGVILLPMYRGYAGALEDAPTLAGRADVLIAEGRAGRLDLGDWGSLRRTGYEMGLEARLTGVQREALGCGPDGCR